MRIHWFQHVPFEGLGSIGPWLAARGHAQACTRLWAGELPPARPDYDWLIVMGGPMNIYEEDRHPWLAAEKRAIAGALAADRRLLGICLGAQLIADALGGPVTRNPQKEIGWFPVELTPAAASVPLSAGLPQRFEAYHWHGDTFAIPPGAVHLAASAACAHQAYSHGARVLGLQFHLESTPESARELIDHARDELVPAPGIQTEMEMLADAGRFGRLNGLMAQLLARLEAA